MGTNYYLHLGVCHACKKPTEALHIGKSSAGWCFALHVYPDRLINDLPDWEPLWAAQGSHIEDEYGRVVPPQEMRQIITERMRGSTHPVGWDFAEYQANHAEPGPNGLVRCKIEQTLVQNDRQSFTNGCIKHGSGPWDCLVGDFS